MSGSWIRLDTDFLNDARLWDAGWEATLVWPAILAMLKEHDGVLDEHHLSTRYIARRLGCPSELAQSALDGIKRVGLLVEGTATWKVGKGKDVVRAGWLSKRWAEKGNAQTSWALVPERIDSSHGVPGSDVTFANESSRFDSSEQESNRDDSFPNEPKGDDSNEHESPPLVSNPNDSKGFHSSPYVSKGMEMNGKESIPFDTRANLSSSSRAGAPALAVPSGPVGTLRDNETSSSSAGAVEPMDRIEALRARLGAKGVVVHGDQAEKWLGIASLDVEEVDELATWAISNAEYPTSAFLACFSADGRTITSKRRPARERGGGGYSAEHRGAHPAADKPVKLPTPEEWVAIEAADGREVTLEEARDTLAETRESYIRQGREVEA